MLLIIQIKKVVQSINTNKSPYPGGYGGGFFRAAWDIIESDVCNSIYDFFQNGQYLKQLSATMISLIPKTEKPKYASQSRPIL